MPPSCPRCDHEITDMESQFCDRCGASFSVVPVIKKLVCLMCGATPLDDETLFCSRCGTPLTKPLSDARPIQPPLFKPVHQTSVKISKKKPLPIAEPPEDLWDPVPEEVMDPGYFSHPQGQPHASQKKKYPHLPLVADEFKEKKSPCLEIETPYYPEPPNEKKVGKKGLFDMMKK